MKVGHDSALVRLYWAGATRANENGYKYNECDFRDFVLNSTMHCQ